MDKESYLEEITKTRVWSMVLALPMVALARGEEEQSLFEEWAEHSVVSSALVLGVTFVVLRRR